MRLKRIAAPIAALTLITSTAVMVPMSSGAAAYTAINGGEFSFEKYLVMKNEANVPNVDFGLTVEPIADSEVIDATTSTLAVMKGPSGIKFKSGVADVTPKAATATEPASATVSFKSSDTTISEENKGSKSLSFKTTDTTDEKFAEKIIKLDLSEAMFQEPGIYRYKITETASTGVAGVTNDTNNIRYLDVYVKNESAGTDAEETTTAKLAVQGYYLHTDAAAPVKGTADSSKKSTGFSNNYTTNDLEFRKVVTGNQGSKDKYFKINVKLSNPDNLAISDSDIFNITGNWDKIPEKNSATKYDTVLMEQANNVSSVTYADLKGEGYSFYIHDGQLIELHGIPSGLGYEITETEEDYSPSVVMNDNGDIKTGDKSDEGTDIDTSKKNSVSDSFLKSDAGIIFTNDRAGNIPTGILSTVAGSAGIVAIGLAGILGGAFYLKKKKSEEE
ncbi:MAG: hypothetical protein K5898_04575 [Ruminococcus sp.]|uniref:DUF7601 domain-containing protein n=1 Tax=Ruminococcus sp. TaxID=41978 RepID=UPI0025FA4052|nr:hypothetical protein [Ruminococcus sp.]MCR4794433.1 hypothetical protein [Ruminococcus sp.]